MTKKDYIEFARLISTSKANIANGADLRLEFELLERNIAYLFQVDNPRFDGERFRKACEVKA